MQQLVSEFTRGICLFNHICSCLTCANYLFNGAAVHLQYMLGWSVELHRLRLPWFVSSLQQFFQWEKQIKNVSSSLQASAQSLETCIFSPLMEGSTPSLQPVSTSSLKVATLADLQSPSRMRPAEL